MGSIISFYFGQCGKFQSYIEQYSFVKWLLVTCGGYDVNNILYEHSGCKIFHPRYYVNVLYIFYIYPLYIIIGALFLVHCLALYTKVPSENVKKDD